MNVASATPTDAESQTGARRVGLTVSAGPIAIHLYTHRASAHQAAKLVAALLRVAGVTAGLAKSNGSLPSGL